MIKIDALDNFWRTTKCLILAPPHSRPSSSTSWERWSSQDEDEDDELMIHQEIVVVHHEASCVSSQRPSVSAPELIKLTFTLSLNPSPHHRSYSTKRKKVFFELNVKSNLVLIVTLELLEDLVGCTGFDFFGGPIGLAWHFNWFKELSILVLTILVEVQRFRLSWLQVLLIQSRLLSDNPNVSRWQYWQKWSPSKLLPA